MLCESKLGKYFKKYENSKLMNLNFMIKGTDELDYKIRKRLYSFNRLKKLLNNFNFDIKKTEQLFFPRKFILLFLVFLGFCFTKNIGFKNNNFPYKFF